MPSTQQDRKPLEWALKKNIKYAVEEWLTVSDQKEVIAAIESLSIDGIDILFPLLRKQLLTTDTRLCLISIMWFRQLLRIHPRIIRRVEKNDMNGIAEAISNRLSETESVVALSGRLNLICAQIALRTEVANGLDTAASSAVSTYLEADMIAEFEGLREPNAFDSPALLEEISDDEDDEEEGEVEGENSKEDADEDMEEDEPEEDDENYEDEE
eukprot:TRINITY_DN3860_c0_g1_i1.p1 TRINITY_DN3860_c0_g1~~TRINITY_DN3860_c0_g1_i1.p1  ORF type:complete len:213 (+),score=52.49 TRINITY_DN3860_c0_g1_i1:234-872(+)